MPFYREIPILIEGTILNIGGFERRRTQDLKKLCEEHNLRAILSVTDRNPHPEEVKDFIAKGHYTCGGNVEIFDWFETSFQHTKRIDPSIFDNIYEVVKSAKNDGLKIGIYCGTGFGRTAMALASLKLRELLESNYKLNPVNFQSLQPQSDSIFVYQEGRANVTPMVKEAIQFIRKYDNREHSSIETKNDVESLVQYEKYLRAQIALEYDPKLTKKIVSLPNFFNDAEVKPPITNPKPENSDNDSEEKLQTPLKPGP